MITYKTSLFFIEEVTKHEDGRVHKCGLMVDITRPYIGALPDALMLIKCHNQSIVEIKCSYAIKE